MKSALALLFLALAACNPSSDHLRTVAKANQVIILTDSEGRKYAAQWAGSDDVWILREVR